MKKIILSSVLLGLAVSTTSVFAEDAQIQAISAVSAPVPTLYTAPVAVSVQVNANGDVIVPTTPEVTTVSSVVEKDEVIKTTNLERMKARGMQLIKERVNSLNANAQAIANSKALTVEQKNAFASFFSGKVTDLNALSVKIASSTDATSTKALVSSIFTDHRIYGVLIPQLRLEKRLYELQSHSVKLSEVFVKVQSRIDEFKNKGKDVSVWQKNLDDTKAMVTADTAKIQTLLVQINALQPANYGTTSKAVIELVNRDTKAIARDFQLVNRKIMKPYFLKNTKVHVTASTTATTTVR